MWRLKREIVLQNMVGNIEQNLEKEENLKIGWGRGWYWDVIQWQKGVWRILIELRKGGEG